MYLKRAWTIINKLILKRLNIDNLNEVNPTLDFIQIRRITQLNLRDSVS